MTLLRPFFRWINTPFLWSLLLMVTLFNLPIAMNFMADFRTGYRGDGTIAPLFTPQVHHWERQIAQWSRDWDVDPNLLATIMQIESCGHPTVTSHAGAQGLFQVMPFHFAQGEHMLDPHTNALRSTNFIHECNGYADGDIGLILACYNGGPRVTWTPFGSWPAETQRYYTWGLGIYADAYTNRSDSPTLDSWLQAGGRHLCNSAAQQLGMRTRV